MNEKIHCGLCSYGMSGSIFHAPLIDAHQQLSLYAILERKHHRAESSYPSIKTFTNYDTMLADPAIDLIVVNIPDHLHADFVEEALLAGKHVVVEKPFTLKVSEAEKLSALARKRSLGLYVFQNRRWDSDFLTIKKLIQEKKLGRIVEFEAHYDRFRPRPTANTWKEDRNYGPGLLYNLGSHLIDQALVLFGLPDEIFADLDCMRTSGKITDYFNLILYYPNHRAILKSSYLVNEQPFKYLIHGDQGTFIKKGQDPQEAHLNDGWKADDPAIGLEAEIDYGRLYLVDEKAPIPVVSEKGNYLQFYEGVVEELNGKPGSAVSAQEGLRVIRLIEAARRSNETGQKIKIL